MGEHLWAFGQTNPIRASRVGVRTLAVALVGTCLSLAPAEPFAYAGPAAGTQEGPSKEQASEKIDEVDYLRIQNLLLRFRVVEQQRTELERQQRDLEAERDKLNAGLKIKYKLDMPTDRIDGHVVVRQPRK